MAGALDGVRVVELGESTASAYAGKLLADLGADVIKVERPGTGDPTRSDGPFRDGEHDPDASGRYLHLNTNKRSLTLDVEQDDGLRLLVDLCAGADVVIRTDQPVRDGRDRLGFEALSARNPDLIMALITPFGMTGPYRDWHGYDSNTGALGGINYYLGEFGRPLLVPPLSLGEYQAGLAAVVAIMAGLVSETGGQLIDIAEADCWAMIQTGLSVVDYIFGGRLFERQGTGRTGGPYPYALLHCKDGLVRIITIQRREWLRFLAVMGNPAWADDPRFQDRTKMTELYADELDALIEDWMKDKTKEEIFQLCREGGVPCAPTYTIDEVVNHPELGKWFVEVDQPGLGPVVQAGFPYDLSESPATIERGAPRLGEHSASILATIGVDENELASLRGAAVT